VPYFFHLINLEWAKRPKLRWIATFFGINFSINIGILFFLILGSGIFPVSGWLFSLIAAATSLILALLLPLIARRIKVGAVLLTLLGVFAVFSVFGYFIDTSFRQAKLYAEKLVPEIEAVHKSKGSWPTSLAEIPPERRPRLNEAAVWPLLLWERNGFYVSIGGLIISYSTNDQEPSLRVGRRDLQASLDWKESRWDLSSD
jgi:hypothetical protein